MKDAQQEAASKRHVPISSLPELLHYLRMRKEMAEKENHVMLHFLQHAPHYASRNFSSGHVVGEIFAFEEAIKAVESLMREAGYGDQL